MVPFTSPADRNWDSPAWFFYKQQWESLARDVKTGLFQHLRPTMKLFAIFFRSETLPGRLEFVARSTHLVRSWWTGYVHRTSVLCVGQLKVWAFENLEWDHRSPWENWDYCAHAVMGVTFYIYLIQLVDSFGNAFRDHVLCILPHWLLHFVELKHWIKLSTRHCFENYWRTR